MSEKKKATNMHTPLPKYYSASRELRNQAEKQRRDKLNYHVTELATLVPFVTRAQKKVDKTSVLRLAASYIRMHKILSKTEPSSAKSMPVALLNADTSRTLLNSIGGFLLVITSAGKVIYASEAIEDTFGYSQADVMGQSFFSLIHQDDEHLVQQQLCPQESLRRSFYCRMLEKSISRSDPRRYEIIHVVGQFKPLPQSTTPTFLTDEKPSARASLRRRTRSEACSVEMSDDEDVANSPSSSSSSSSDFRHDQSDHDTMGTHMLVAFVQVVHDKPITELTWVESMRDEYITRHQLDGNISYVDHRISFVTGLMPEEVMGNSAFQYMCKEDILWSIFAQKQMLTSSQGHGMVTYRLVCKDGSYVSLRSRGFLEVNKDTGKVDTFVCINTVLRDCDALEEVKNQRKQLLPLFSGQTPEDLALCIGKGLPHDLSLLVKGLMNKETLQNMLRNVENVTITTVERNQCSSMDHSRKQQKTSHSRLKEVSPDPQPSISGVSTKSFKKRSKKTINGNTRRKLSVDPFPSPSSKSPTLMDTEHSFDSTDMIEDPFSIASPNSTQTVILTSTTVQYIPSSDSCTAEIASSLASVAPTCGPTSPSEWSMIGALTQNFEGNMEEFGSPDDAFPIQNFLDPDKGLSTDYNSCIEVNDASRDSCPSLDISDPDFLPPSLMEVSMPTNYDNSHPQSYCNNVTNTLPQPLTPSICTKENDDQNLKNNYYFINQTQSTKIMSSHPQTSRQSRKSLGFLS